LFIAVQFAVALLIIAKHHQNIRRLLKGTESRFGTSSSRSKEKA
jgi:glycerol-3-phosphate acyltransferase PlsY